MTMIKKACPSGKIRHVNLESAQVYQRKLRKGWEVLEAYQCNRCKGWHLGHPKGHHKKKPKDMKFTPEQKEKRKKAKILLSDIKGMRKQDVMMNNK